MNLTKAITIRTIALADSKYLYCIAIYTGSGLGSRKYVTIVFPFLTGIVVHKRLAVQWMVSDCNGIHLRTMSNILIESSPFMVEG